MTVAAFRAEVGTALRMAAWDQWSQLGVSGAPPRQREERVADPEALLLFTLEVGRGDPRLFDEVLDWLALNESLVSVHRLRNLCRAPADRMLVESALAWVKRQRRPTQRSSRVDASASLLPLFPSIPSPSGDLDPAFAQHGMARSWLAASGKSQAPRLRDPISFAFRLRRVLGVGVRAEVLRTLLTMRAYRLSGKVIAESAAFAQRNVREGLGQLVEAGVVESSAMGYAVDPDPWAALLGLDSTPMLPLYFDWIPALRALASIHRWLATPGLDVESPYLRASRARTLVSELESDLRSITAPANVYTAHGADYWGTFEEITRAAIRRVAPSG